MSYVPLGQHDHDSLQFHFFCSDLVGAARVFLSPSLNHTSIWIYDRGEIRELYSGVGSVGHSDADRILVDGPLSISVAGNDVEILCYDCESDQKTIRIRLFVEWEIKWGDTISYVIHQPFIGCRIEYNGKTYYGHAYCKQYFWSPAPRHWGYRFVQGFSTEGVDHLWTAEATFGPNKYDYFKIIRNKSELLSADEGSSSHRQNSVNALLYGESTYVELNEKAAWEVNLRSERMDTLLRQRVCEMSVRVGDDVFNGMAINETCYGTLG